MMMVPETQNELYHYYLQCLKQIIDHERFLGKDFGDLTELMRDTKQVFLAFVKGVKDDE